MCRRKLDLDYSSFDLQSRNVNSSFKVKFIVRSNVNQMIMAYDDDFAELDRMLLARSTDYQKMRAILQGMAQTREIARMLVPAQDNLYASIARSHRKALVHLEGGDQMAAKREMASAVAWFIKRFEGQPAALEAAPKIADELRESCGLAERSEVLRQALQREVDIHA
jgi:hypothetical protein